MLAAVITEGLVLIACLLVLWKVVEQSSKDRERLEQKVIALSQPQALAAVDAAIGPREFYPVEYVEPPDTTRVLSNVQQLRDEDDEEA
jgi:hypothetical protein